MSTVVPKLFLKNQTQLIQIETDQCSPLVEAYKGGRGVSEMPYPRIDLYNDNGEQIGEISYNGPNLLDTSEGHIEVPRVGRPTAKELFG